MEKLKEMLGYLVCLVIFGAILAAVVSMYIDDFVTSERKSSEQYILEKQSEKGLFFGPRYQIITNHDIAPSLVTKKKFESLELGDTIQGHLTNTKQFYTKTDDFYAVFTAIVLIVLIGAALLLFLFLFLISIPYIDKKLTELNGRKQGKIKKQRRRKKKIKFWMVLAGILVAIGLVFNTLYTVNLFHKIVPIAQTTVEAEIIDQVSDINITSKGNFSTHYLTVRFTAEDGQDYRVEKEVTGTTYNKWASETSIDIRYRNSNPYTIFIKTTSVFELISVLLHRWTIVYLMFLLVIFGAISYYSDNRKRRRKKHT